MSRPELYDLNANLIFDRESAEFVAIADYDALLEYAEQFKTDAARYRWLRSQTWDKSAVCVVTEPKETVRLGTYCPSGDQLDAAIDAAIATESSNG